MWLIVRSDERDKVYRGIRSRREGIKNMNYLLYIRMVRTYYRVECIIPLWRGNKIVGGMVLAEDITERRLAQRALESARLSTGLL